MFESRRIPSALRKGERRRGNRKLWPGSQSPASWMAVHGLERSVCQLHSQQTGPDVKPDESWRRSCLIDKLWKCFPHRPKVIFPLQASCVCRWESLGCQYANTCLHRPQRGKGTGLAQSSLLQAGKTSAWTQCSGQQPITNPPHHLCWGGLSLPASSKGKRPSAFPSLFVVVVVCFFVLLS